MPDERKNEAEGLEVPSSLVSEFYEVVFGRIIPGSIFLWLYFKAEIPTNEIIPVAFMFLCFAWFIGSAIDLTGHTILILVFGMLPWLKNCKNEGESHRRRNFWERFDPNHAFVRELSLFDQRRIGRYFCDKIFFRGMGFICLFMVFFTPNRWPFLEPNLPYIVNLPFYHSFVADPHYLPRAKPFGFIGAVVCAVCWCSVQSGLNRQEQEHFERIEKSKARERKPD